MADRTAIGFPPPEALVGRNAGVSLCSRAFCRVAERLRGLSAGVVLLAAAVLLLGLCATASAGPVVSHELSFQEVDAVTHEPVPMPNGIIEPGEAALITLSVHFAPRVGSVLEEPWTSHALRRSWFHLLSGAGVSAEGTWHGLRITPGWETNVGNPDPGGASISGIQVTQNEPQDQSNPVVDVWQGIWVPAEYSARTVLFGTWCQMSPGACSSIWVHNTSTGAYMGWPAALTLEASVTIPISPKPPSCYADCDGNGTLNIDDFLCFINEFSTAQALPSSQQITHYANCDGSTTEPVLTIDDFLCFINQFSQGCP